METRHSLALLRAQAGTQDSYRLIIEMKLNQELPPSCQPQTHPLGPSAPTWGKGAVSGGVSRAHGLTSRGSLSTALPGSHPQTVAA